MSGSRVTALKDSGRRPSGIVTVPGVGAPMSSRKDVKPCQSLTPSPGAPTVKTSPRSPGTLSMGTRTSTTVTAAVKSTAPSPAGNDAKLNKTTVVSMRGPRPSSAPENKIRSLPVGTVPSRPSTTESTSRSPAPTMRQSMTSSVTSTRGKPQPGSVVTPSSSVRQKTMSSAAKQAESKLGSRVQNGNETRSRDVSKSAGDGGGQQTVMERREDVDIDNNTMPHTGAIPAPGQIRQTRGDTPPTQASEDGDKITGGSGTSGAGHVRVISACSENTTVAPPYGDQEQPTDVSPCPCAVGDPDLETRQDATELCRDPAAPATVERDAPTSEQHSDSNGTPAENDLMRSGSQVNVGSERSDVLPAAATELISCADIAQSDIANDRSRVNEVDDTTTASCSSQTDSSALDTTADDDATDAESCSSDDVITTTRNANYFTVTPRDCDSLRPSDSYSTCESNGPTSCGEVTNSSSNVHVERRICEIAAELNERNSLYIYTKHRSRDSIGGDDVSDRLLRLEQTCDRLTRENSSLSDLLTSKKLECVETRQWYRGRVKDLEDDVTRLKMEKCRLLDRLQLPESERASLTAEENALSEMRRKLEETEEKLEITRNENVELRQDLRDAELAMQELHDQFQAEESIELRELQRELENTSRDCRLLHFKLRKAERRNEQLQGEFDELQMTANRLTDRSNEDRRKVRQLDEELATAKDISIRLHDECERLQAECHAYRQKLSRDSSSLNILEEACSNRSSESRSSIDYQSPQQQQQQQQQQQHVDDMSNGSTKTDHLTSSLDQLDNHVTVTSSALGGDEDCSREERQREISEYELQLSRADQEINCLQRRVGELSKENDDLMKAVSYLRSKLESNSSPAKRRASISDVTDADGPYDVEQTLGNGSNGDHAHARSRDNVDLSTSDVIGDSIAHSSDKDAVIPMIGDHSVKCRDDTLGVSTVSNGKLAELEDDNS